MALGQNILELRKKQGLSQEQLGEKIDVTRQTISNWELGETQPNPEQLKLLSKTLNISIDELLDNDLQNILVNKLKITEKQTKNIKAVLKALLVAFILFFIVDVIALIICFTGKLGPFSKNKEINSQYVIQENIIDADKK